MNVCKELCPIFHRECEPGECKIIKKAMDEEKAELINALLKITKIWHENNGYIHNYFNTFYCEYKELLEKHTGK